MQVGHCQKVGDQWRMFVGMNDHHEMWRWMPQGFEPDPEKVTALDVAVDKTLEDVPEKDGDPAFHAAEDRELDGGGYSV